jgi:hypothetical protein
VVSDEDVEEIAKHLTDWEQLSPHLGLDKRTMQDLSYGEEQLKHERLKLWKRNQKNGATYGALITAAKNAHLHLEDAARLSKTEYETVKARLRQFEVALKNLVLETTFCLAEKRGLAVLVTCDYKTEYTGMYAHTPLDACNADAREMKDALVELGFDVHQLKNKNATKKKVESLLLRISAYLHRYGRPRDHVIEDNRSKAIVFAFAGHGEQGDYIITHDDKKLHVAKDIVNPLLESESGNSDVCTIPKLFFIDACRGKKQIRGVEVYEQLIGNCRVDYATSPDHVSYDARGWMQRLAQKLKDDDDSLQHVVSKLNEELYEQPVGKQRSWSYDSLNTGPFYLKKVPQPTQTGN